MDFLYQTACTCIDQTLMRGKPGQRWHLWAICNSVKNSIGSLDPYLRETLSTIRFNHFTTS